VQESVGESVLGLARCAPPLLAETIPITLIKDLAGPGCDLVPDLDDYSPD
jgi:hypothetical protein